jgi:hypothetical protein
VIQSLFNLKVVSNFTWMKKQIMQEELTRKKQ